MQALPHGVDLHSHLCSHLVFFAPLFTPGIHTCRHCLKESTRASEFADLTLAIRTFADPPVNHTSLLDALDAFLEPEHLDGDNQYLQRE